MNIMFPKYYSNCYSLFMYLLFYHHRPHSQVLSADSASTSNNSLPLSSIQIIKITKQLYSYYGLHGNGEKLDCRYKK